MLQQAVQSGMERLTFSYGCQQWLLGSFMYHKTHSATALQHKPYSVVAQRPQWYCLDVCSLESWLPDIDVCTCKILCLMDV